MSEPQTVESLYPDLIQEGGLLSAVKRRLVPKLAGIEVNGFGTGLSYAWVQFGSRASQMFLRLNERRFAFDLFQEGKPLAVGTTPSLDEALGSILYWLSSRCSADDLIREFPFVRHKLNTG